MSQPTLAELKPRLRLALEQLAIVPRFESHRVIARQGTFGVERAVRLMVESKQDWAPGVPALSEIEDWLSVHWSPNRETQAPAGTVPGDDRLGQPLEPQLDVAAAACKLLLAAQLHGAAAVATHAVNFTRHGMVEARTMVLLSGGRVAKRTPLDDFVALLPYERGLETWREATRDAPAELLQPLPENMAGSLCAIELTTFEDRRGGHDEFRRYESPLLRCGLDNLLLILGLVSGRAFRKLAGTHGAEDAIRATLPFLYVPSHAPWQRQMAFHDEWTAEHHVTERPLDVQELVRLLRRFADLPEQTQRVLTLAMRRLSDSTERIELEDRVIDLCIALEAMFTDGWQPQLKKVVAGRVSWFFADTSAERETTRSQLKQFYAARSAIVHGRVPISLTGNAQNEESQLTALTDDVENVVRTSVADMITEGRPNDWEASRSVAEMRRGRPRPKSETRSIKSESTSWSLAEQEEIDRALEAVWKPELTELGRGSDHPRPIMQEGVSREAVERCRSEGIPYVMSVPIRLYWAHPRWPQQVGLPLDERTAFNCERDVRRHLEQWRRAATDSGLTQLVLHLDQPSSYRPETFDAWRQWLQQVEAT